LGRHREFDEDVVLDAVTTIFWRQGFRGTSIRDLARETGLAEARLYNAFGDKRRLFFLALERYRARGLRFVNQITESEDPLLAIHDFVLAIARNLARQRDFRGCLITNTMIEMASHDKEIREQLKASFEVRNSIFRQALKAAQRQGQLDKRADVRALAQYLVQILEGLRVIAKSDPGEKSLVDTAEFALSLLAASPSRRRKMRVTPAKASNRTRA
jgi:TetR/AcrR family transcriptional regulator, transcriptional repressor for nem operon